MKKISPRIMPHAAVLRKHGFKAAGRTFYGNYRFRHPCGTRAYHAYSKAKGWRTSVRFKGLWGWTSYFYANHLNLDKFLTRYK